MSPIKSSQSVDYLLRYSFTKQRSSIGQLKLVCQSKAPWLKLARQQPVLSMTARLNFKGGKIKIQNVKEELELVIRSMAKA